MVYIRLVGIPNLPAYSLHLIFREDPLSQEEIIYFICRDTFFWYFASLLMAKVQLVGKVPTFDVNDSCLALQYSFNQNRVEMYPPFP